MSENFTKEQEQAINHFNGPAIVIAGPGSGKTHTLTHRVKRLIERGVHPENILVITFTKAAAKEMKGRFDKLMDCNEQNYKTGVEFGTFHSIFYNTIKEILPYQTHKVITGNAQMRFFTDYFYSLVKETVEQTNKSYAQVIHKRLLMRSRTQAEQFIDAYAKVRNESRDIQDLSDLEISTLFLCQRDTVAKAISQYKKYKMQGKLLDFDDMQTIFLSEINSNPSLLFRLRMQFQYILVDEFQDINPIQYQIIRLLSHPMNNLFVVGDEDQAIYAFRGSSPDFFVHFTKDYSNACQIFLNRNFRSDQKIIDSSSGFILNNQNRNQKAFIGEAKETGGPVFFSFKNKKTESDFICDFIEYHHKKTAYSSMALLFRTNNQAEHYASILKKNHIPFVLNDKKYMPTNDLYYAIKVLLAFKKTTNTSLFMKLCKLNLINDAILETEQNESAKLSDLQYFVSHISNLKLHQIVIWYSLRFYLQSHFNVRGIGETISVYKAALKSNTLKDFCVRYSKQMHLKYKDFVNISTIHKAKGLEYQTVIIPDITKECYPHPLSNDLEEERRILYVGMTRAKNTLFLSTTDNSQFVKELSATLKIVHKTF